MASVQTRLIIDGSPVGPAPNILKRCSKCKRNLPLRRFNADATKPNGRYPSCKKCRRKVNSARYYKTSEAERLKSKLYARENPWLYWANGTYRGHHDQGYIMEVNRKYLTALAKATEFCPLCGIQLRYLNPEYRKGNRGPSATLDRINNEGVLRASNIKIICFRCNMSKMDRTWDEFVEYCGMIWRKFGAPAS